MEPEGNQDGGRLSQLRAAGLVGGVRLAYRKAIYRKVLMGRYGAPARDHVVTDPPLELRLEIVGADRFDDILGTSPHLSKADVDRFKATPSSCILVWDGDRLASSSWMTRGTVWVSELQRSIEVGEDERFSCRSWVDPDYRGRALFSHMIQQFAAQQDPDVLVWGLIYPRNGASLVGVQRIGWLWSGNYWTHHVLTRKVGGQELFEPRPIVLPPRS